MQLVQLVRAVGVQQFSSVRVGAVSQHVEHEAPQPGQVEAVDVHVALRSYTAWAAHQLFIDDRTGSIMPNKDADIAIWDRDPYTVSVADVREMHCEMTLFQGRIVYRDEKAPIILR